MSPSASFELLRFVALPAGAELAVVELEGRLRPAAQRSGATPRALKARLLLEDDEGRLDIPAATSELEGRVLRASFAVPAGRLAGSALAVGVRDLLFDLPAPDTIPGAEREVALAREANALRRELAAARAEAAGADEAREAALAEIRREGEERLAAAELLIARERQEAAGREAALAQELEAARQEAAARDEQARAAAAAREEEVRAATAAREEEVRREAEARDEAARRAGAAMVADARREADARLETLEAELDATHRDADARVAALEAELDAARRDADAREGRARQEAAARVEPVRPEGGTRAAAPLSAPPEQATVELGAVEPDLPAPPPRPAPDRGPDPAPPSAGRRQDPARGAPERGADPRPPAAGRRQDPASGAPQRGPGPGLPPVAMQPGSDVPPEDPPPIRPSTAAGRTEPRAYLPPRREDRGPGDWADPDAPSGGGLFEEPYDPRPRGPGAGSGPGRSVLVDPDDLDDEATTPQPLRRVRRTGAAVPPRGQGPAQSRRPAASRPDERDAGPGDPARTRYLVVAIIVVAILLALLGILAL